MHKQRIIYLELLEATYKLGANKISTANKNIEIIKENVSQSKCKPTLSPFDLEKKSSLIDFEFVNKYASALSGLGVSLSDQFDEPCFTAEGGNDCSMVCTGCTGRCMSCVTCVNCVSIYP